MDRADRSPMSAQEFLRWTETLPEGKRYELVSGEAVAMSPETNRHNLVKVDCCLALRRGVRDAGLDCAVLGDGATVVVSDDDVYEPDVTIQCSEPIDLDATTVPYPVILVEVLSPATRSVDSHGKLLGYFQLPSVEHYVVVDPTRCTVIHHHRSDHGIGTATLREGSANLEPPGLTFEVADLFGSITASSN